MKNILFLFSLIAIIGLSACTKEEQTEKTGTATVDYEFVFGSVQAPFALNQEFVHPMTGDSLTFNVFKFYVSSIQLQKSDGTWWQQEDSYHLVDVGDAANGGTSIMLSDIPVGEYTAIKYTLGVDSTRNVSGAQTGALDPAEGMYWDWNSGYRMILTEGTSPQSSSGTFAFHLGGFSGDFNIVSTYTKSFNSSTLTIEEGTPHAINFKANPAKLWHNGASVATTRMIHMPNATATTMGTNFFNAVNYTSID